MVLTNATGQDVLELIFYKNVLTTQAPHPLQDAYLGLLTTMPTGDSDDPDTGNFGSFTGAAEASGYNYGRVKVVSNGSINDTNLRTTYRSYSLGESSNKAHYYHIGNLNDINFNACINTNNPDITGTGWGDIKGWALYTTATGGNPFAWGKLTDRDGVATTVTVNLQNTFHFFRGRFEIYLDDAGYATSSASASTT